MVDLIDNLVCLHTPLATMEDLVECNFKLRLQAQSAPNSNERSEMEIIADRYDKIMLLTGDSRRVERF